MADDLPTQVDEYLAELLVPSDTILDEAVQAGIDARMPQIQVSPVQGKFLYLLARIQGARRILEVGTLAGYSTLWLARALPPEGRLVTLELNPDHAAVAGSNLRRAGLDSIVEVRVGSALDSLAALVEENVEPFDLVFIDADRRTTPSTSRGHSGCRARGPLSSSTTWSARAVSSIPRTATRTSPGLAGCSSSLPRNRGSKRRPCRQWA
jgi:predicted O-methyltransferase YrrM